MKKGARKIRYNLRQKFQTLSGSGKKKSKHIVHRKDCPCPPEYFNVTTGVCSCICHSQIKTAHSQEQSKSASILQQESSPPLATQAGQPSPSTSQVIASHTGLSNPSANPLVAQTSAEHSSPNSTPELTDSSDSESETDHETDHETNNETDNEIDNNIDHEDETSLLLSPSVHKKTFTAPEETKQVDDSSDKEEYTLPCPNSPSRDALFPESNTASDMADLQKEMVNLQRQMCRQMEAAQATLSIPYVTESTVVKPYPTVAKMRMLTVGSSVLRCIWHTER